MAYGEFNADLAKIYKDFDLSLQESTEATNISTDGQGLFKVPTKLWQCDSEPA